MCGSIPGNFMRSSRTSHYHGMMKASKGCWSCKARKVQCDRDLPTCRKCARAKRECQGYGLRLSWPRAGDKKRTMTSPASLDQVNVFVRPETFVNTTSRDIELYRHLSLQSASQPPRLVHSTPKLWMQPQSRVNHVDLLQYFHDTAHNSLPTFETITIPIRDSLMRLALSHHTVASRALFYALLAVSSLHRSGLHQETVQFKVSALQALSASVRGVSLNSAAAIQHVAACMLLGAFEVLQPSQGSGEWLVYVRGAVNIIQETNLEEKLDQSDINNLISWVYYHYALSRFAMHHWRHKSVALETADANELDTRGFDYPSLVKSRTVLRTPNPAHAILNLLAETCDTLVDPRDPNSRNEEYRDRLRALEQKIRTLPTAPISAKPSAVQPLVVELYQIATLIYLIRSSESPWEPSAILGSLVERAFEVPGQTCFCQHFFPLFILACEARTEEQRYHVLQIMEKSENVAHMRSMKRLRAQIHFVWVQQDLHMDDELLVDYLGLMNTIISSNTFLPSYV